MKQSNVTGLFLLGLGFFFFGSADTLAKLLTGTLHPIQIVWSRQAGLVVVALVIVLVRGRQQFHTVAPRLQVVRGTIAALSAVCFVSAVRYVPLADAVAVSFVAPFMVTVLGALVLGEAVSVNRWVTIAVGFAGAMVIIRPGMGVFHPAIFLVVLAAAFFAMRQILSRKLAASDNVLTTLIYTALASFALLTLPLPWVWQAPQSPRVYLMLAAMAGLAAVGETLVIKSFQIAEAVVVAPMHYTLIIWATLFGWAVFGNLPDVWTVLGTSIIVATGLYLVLSERASARSRQP